MSSMRVIFDARSVVSHASGIGNYAASLLRHMVGSDDDTIFTVLRNSQSAEPLVDSDKVREVVLIPGETKSVATLLSSKRVMKLREHDLYHSPSDIVPMCLPCPFVATMHDMMWIEKPRLAASFLPTRIAMHYWYKSHYTHSIRKARRVIAVSKSTSDAIARLFPDQASKIRVVHHGIDRERFCRAKVPARNILDSWVPRGSPFALAVGQGSPYKNHPNIIRAFLQATSDMPDHRLVLVQRFSRRDSELRHLLASQDVRQKVLVYSFVPDDVLMALYGYAQMLLFASLYEGCGMPAMEAMALETPVVASQAPALVEMTGDAALHAEADNVSDISRKIRSLICDDTLRRSLIEKGLQRIGMFTWDKCASATLSVYREAVSDIPRR